MIPLGLRLAFSGGREALIRLAILAAAVGIGVGLLERAVGSIASAGAGDATLWVFEKNAPARTFYARRGFHPDGTTRIEPEFGVSEVRLARVLEHPDAR